MDATARTDGVLAMIWDAEKLKALRKMAGLFPTSQIARDLEISKSQLTDGARKYGISLKVNGQSHHLSKTTDADRLRLISLIESGVSIAKAARAVGIPYRRAQYIFNYHK
jgi:hypothetical protein